MSHLQMSPGCLEGILTIKKNAESYDYALLTPAGKEITLLSRKKHISLASALWEPVILFGNWWSNSAEEEKFLVKNWKFTMTADAI